ncbi:unnamed protein product, partial [Mycena citricolor]
GNPFVPESVFIAKVASDTHRLGPDSFPSLLLRSPFTLTDSLSSRVKSARKPCVLHASPLEAPTPCRLRRVPCALLKHNQKRTWS